MRTFKVKFTVSVVEVAEDGMPDLAFCLEHGVEAEDAKKAAESFEKEVASLTEDGLWVGRLWNLFAWHGPKRG